MTAETITLKAAARAAGRKAVEEHCIFTRLHKKYESMPLPRHRPIFQGYADDRFVFSCARPQFHEIIRIHKGNISTTPPNKEKGKKEAA